MSPAKRFLDALGFFTSLVPARLVSNSTLGECAPWIFPCGLVIGALCTLASLAASILLTMAATCPDVIALLLAALVWILAELRITRALHWDGLADLADAIG
ncbi:MAG: adenosylcobinamide-GDP ribazoletransferase, partial [Candidatus Desulfovibrio faecigallinarum]|nr:adenosylcobinamide-GDP ribazoletransferase [Candidatus Desulfovibrio faecigallinarum]